MIKQGVGCRLGKFKVIGQGDISLGDNVTISDNVVINVSEVLFIDDRSHIGEYFEIEGRHIKIGKEFWSGRFCGIGGGSSFEKPSSLEIGHQCHLGDFAFINTARSVKIGDEVGLGQQTKIYTHGAYLSFLKGFPVKFGPVTLEYRVWCPGAIILPDVTIGHDTVVAVGSVVNKSLPAGCLAAGVPARVIRENCFPAVLHPNQQLEMLETFIGHFITEVQPVPHLRQVGFKIFLGDTLFDLHEMKIEGAANEVTEKFKDELRRYGVRFRYYNKEGSYVHW